MSMVDSVLRVQCHLLRTERLDAFVHFCSVWYSVASWDCNDAMHV